MLLSETLINLTFAITVNEMKCEMPGELPMPCMPTDAAMLLVLLAPELLGIC